MKPAWDGWAWVCKIVPVAWKKYLGRKATPLELAFNPEGADENVPPTATQIASAERAAKDTKLVQAVTAAIRERYAKELGKRRLEEMVELQEMFVQPLERDGVAFVGFGFSAAWDREHGLGVLTHATRVLEIGGAEVAFVTWMAKRHTGPQPVAKKPAPRKAKPRAEDPKPVVQNRKPAARKPKPVAPRPKRKPKPVKRKKR